MVRAQLGRQRAADARAGRAPAARPAAGGGDAGARQLRQRRHLRPLPDRDAAGRDDRLGRAVGELGLRRRAGHERRRCAWRSRSPGRSPDLLAAAEAARAAGALVVALVNDAASPLAELAEVTAPLLAGPELSVAATKSYIAALSAIVQLAAHWSGDATLHGGAGRAAGPARARLGAGLERRLAAAAGRAEPLRPRPRPRLRHRRGGGAEAQGDLRPARRGVQRRRGAPRADGAGRAGLSGPRLRPGRRDARRRGGGGRRGGGAGRAGAEGRRRRRRAGVISLPTRARLPGAGADRLCAELLSAGRTRWRWPAASTPTGRRTSPRSPRPSDGPRARQRPGDDRARACRGPGGAPARRSDRRARAARRASRLAPKCATWRARLLLPGFIDTQVNGGGGVLFNEAPTPTRPSRDRRRAPSLRHDRLPADPDQRRPGDGRRRDRGDARRRSRPASPGVLGLHIEGPFLNARRARHPRRQQAAPHRRGLGRSADLARRRPHPGDAGAGGDQPGDHRAAGRAPASWSPPATPTPPTPWRAPRWTTA